MDAENRTNGLILTGGGARAAFQVGVLAAIADMQGERGRAPFPVITGASAGSINAMLLASRARDFGAAVSHMNGLWSNLTLDKVFRSDTRTMLRTSARWLAWMTFRRKPPPALLDNAPLRRMLETHCRLARIQQAIDGGDIEALAITAASYTTARSVTFFQGRAGLVSWSRTRRDGVMANINLDHVMASVALPIIFPAVAVNGQYFGDGSMRQSAPLSAPIHLGADRLLVIGMRNEDPRKPDLPEARPEYPTFGEIAGYVLDSLFMDALYSDLERLRRINELIRQVKDGPRRGLENLREIDVTVIVPSEDLRELAQRHIRRLPRTFKTMLRLLGANREHGTQLASYLMFDGNYCRELIELGYQDGMKHRAALEKFLADKRTSAEPDNCAHSNQSR